MKTIKACFYEYNSEPFYKDIQCEEAPPVVLVTHFPNKFDDGSFKIGSIVPEKNTYYLQPRLSASGRFRYLTSGRAMIAMHDDDHDLDFYDVEPLEIYR